MATDQQIQTVIKADLSWFQKHERLILGLCLLCTVLWLGNKWLDNSAVAAKTALGIQQAENEKVRVQANLSAAQYQATIDALSKQNSSLAAAVATRQTVLVQQQAATAALATSNPNEFTQTWQKLIPGTLTGGIAQQSITLPDGTHSQQFVVDLGPAIETVNQLEEVPVLKADKADLQTVISNDKKMLAAADVDLKAKDALLQSNDKTCKDQIAVVKANANKSKRTWFIIGFVAGISTRILAKF